MKNLKIGKIVIDENDEDMSFKIISISDIDRTSIPFRTVTFILSDDGDDEEISAPFRVDWCTAEEVSIKAMSRMNSYNMEEISNIAKNMEEWW